MLYLALFILAIWINRGHKKALLLVLMVGFSHYLPVKLITDFNLWYLVCIIAETSKIILSQTYKTHLRFPVSSICLLMISAHIISWYFDGVTQPYHFIIPYLEHLEIFCCILFSHTIINKISKEVKCLLSKQWFTYSEESQPLASLLWVLSGRYTEKK